MTDSPTAALESTEQGIPASVLAWAEAQHEDNIEQVFVIDDQYRMMFINASLEKLSSARRKEILNTDVRDFFPLYRRPLWLGSLTSALKGMYTASSRCFIDPTMPEHRVTVTYAPVYAAGGRMAGAVVVRREKGMHHATLERVNEIEVRFQTMANFSPVLLWMSERDSLCSFFNQTWLDFTGRCMEDELGVKWAEGIHPEDFQNCMDSYMGAFTSRVPFRMTYRLRRFDGEYRWILDTGVPRYSPAKEFLGYIGSCVDITERIRAEESLRDIVGRLNRSNAELERFAYVASHDLQEPILTILNYCDLLASEHRADLNQDAQDCVSRMHAAAKHMRTLIHDLLEYSTVRNVMDVLQPVKLEDVVREIIHDMQPSLDQRDAKIELYALPNLRGDPVQLRQLFANLIGNAVKFQRQDVPPRIVIKAVKDRSPPNTTTPLVGVRIEDNGCGIEQKYIPAIFEPFKKFHGPRYAEGTGIGLAICRRIVDNHGGMLEVESVVNQGTTFILWLPAS